MISTVNGRSLPRVLLRVSLAVSVSGVLGVLLFVPLPPTPLGAHLTPLLNFGHFVLFAAATLFLWRKYRQDIGLALCVAVGMAGLCELGQFFSGRTVSGPDFCRGVLGAMFAAVIIDACRKPYTFSRRASHLTLAVLLAAWPVAETMPVWVGAYFFITA